MMVSDAALGNVKEDGSVTGQPDERLHSQSCFIITMVDPQLLAGGTGKFNVLDFGSNRIPRGLQVFIPCIRTCRGHGSRWIAQS